LQSYKNNYVETGQEGSSALLGLRIEGIGEQQGPADCILLVGQRKMQKMIVSGAVEQGHPVVHRTDQMGLVQMEHFVQGLRIARLGPVVAVGQVLQVLLEELHIVQLGPDEVVVGQVLQVLLEELHIVAVVLVPYFHPCIE
jgi:hypothetical protein